ncbi:MAG: hypothetical protein H7239_07235 [Flavobacterium sp.]|nr:hypothetical protein [Flavobacterium sp.]
MRKSILYILLLSFLLQSCYSYREIDKSSTLVIGKKYKIKQSNKYEKVRLLSFSDSTITVSNNKNSQNTIAIKDINKIKKRHFSVTKTVLLPIGILVVTASVAVIIVSSGNFIIFAQ